MSAFLVTPEHISEIVKYAKKKEFRYAYNCFTKEQIDYISSVVDNFMTKFLK